LILRTKTLSFCEWAIEEIFTGGFEGHIKYRIVAKAAITLDNMGFLALSINNDIMKILKAGRLGPIYLVPQILWEQRSAK
jgi:hypothetical protein